MPAILGAATHKGCPHEPHEVYCIENSCTLCVECSRDLLLSQQGSQTQNRSLTMTSLRELSRLVTEDLGRLRLTHLCMEKAQQSLRLEGDSALDSEAKRCKEEIDRFLLRVVQGVQLARERLYKDVDSYVAERRRLLDDFAVTKRHVDSLLFDVETILSGSALHAASLDSNQRQIATAHLLSAAEERVVLDAESSLERLFPFLKEVSAVDANARFDRRKVAPRDIVSLPNGHELHLAPFTLRLSTAATALLSELEQLKVKKNGNPGTNASELVRETDADALGGSTRTPSSSGSQKVSRREKWKPCQGVGSEGARRRNIRTPDILA